MSMYLLGPGGGLICEIFLRGVNIFVMKRDRGGRGSEKVKISMTSFINGPLRVYNVLFKSVYFSLDQQIQLS